MRLQPLSEDFNCFIINNKAIEILQYNKNNNN